MNKRKIIVSLTSWTKRIDNVPITISTLLNQTVKPDLIELNLSLIEFPNKTKSLPIELRTLIAKNKPVIEINWTEDNPEVFKKIIPTLKKFYKPNKDGDDDYYYLLSADDDIKYRNDYIEIMIKNIEKYDTDTFCLGNATVCGNRQIYKSNCFDDKLWKCLTQEIIDCRIDDLYYERYLRLHKKKFAHHTPNDIKEIIIPFNQVFPNSHNTHNGKYPKEDVQKAKDVIGKTNFIIQEENNSKKIKHNYLSKLRRHLYKILPQSRKINK